MLVTLIRKSLSHASRLIVVASPIAPPTPTVKNCQVPNLPGKKFIRKFLPMLTRMCTAPKNSTVLATAFLQDSSLLTSAWMISEIPPSSSIIRFVSLAQSRLKSTRATLAPCLARRIAAARPFPISPVMSQPKRTLEQDCTCTNSPSIRDPAPVTMATSPVKSNARGGVMIVFESGRFVVGSTFSDGLGDTGQYQRQLLHMTSTAHQNKPRRSWFWKRFQKTSVRNWRSND